ncbi:MAG: F0F1 ATP synthase subunit delta [Lachnospiraceae bacterium]|nr:F0F1 ATP synthase subunit delta [Lachnospiraceae bacterium]
MAKLVSKTYGDALFDIAAEENRMDEFFEEAAGVLTVLKENAELSKLMNHPKIVKEEKIQIIENIFKGKICDEIVGLLRMIVDKGRFGELEAVLEYFIERVKESKNIGTAFVTTPMALSEVQKKQIVDKLIATTKYVEFEMHYDIDAALIGGMVIRIGDRVVDSSVKTKLYDLSRELSKIQLKVGECAP